MKKMLSFILLVVLAVTACRNPKTTVAEYQQVKGVSTVHRADTAKAEYSKTEAQSVCAVLGVADTFTFALVKDFTEYDSAGAVMSRAVTRYTGNGYRGKGAVLTSDMEMTATSEGSLTARTERGDSTDASVIRTKETAVTHGRCTSSPVRCLLIILVFYALSIIQAQRSNTLKA